MPALHALKRIRTATRLARTGLHLLWALATAACAFPFLPLAWRRALKARWSRQLLAVLGVRLSVSGPPTGGGLLVANHVSWLDIYAINALVPTAFVAKDDVRAWPLIGWLSVQAETIFMRRGNRSAAMRTKAQLVAGLRAGGCIGVFPEGTTSAGASVLPFHSALFQSVIDARSQVMPVAVRYTDKAGGLSAAPVYIGETSLWQCLRAIADEEGLAVHLAFLPPLDCDSSDRRQIADSAQRAIAASLAGPQPGARLATSTSRCHTQWSASSDARPHASI